MSTSHCIGAWVPQLENVLINEELIAHLKRFAECPGGGIAEDEMETSRKVAFVPTWSRSILSRVSSQTTESPVVTLAQAGVQPKARRWIPAFAGMTRGAAGSFCRDERRSR